MRGGTHGSHARALERAAYRERVLFDYWCHEASLCHTADLPVHRWAMRTYLARLSPARAVVREWLAVNEEFARSTVSALEAAGPMRANELEDRSAEAWVHGHWTDEVSSRQTIARMLDRLWMQGLIGVADRHGTARRWDLMERCLPSGALAATDAEPLEEAAAVRGSAAQSGMLGVARAAHVNAHFTRGAIRGLPRRSPPSSATASSRVSASPGCEASGGSAAATSTQSRPSGRIRRTVALSPTTTT